MWLPPLSRFSLETALKRFSSSSSVNRFVSSSDVQAFADLTGDHNPIHTDKGASSIAHGTLLLGYVSGAIATRWPGTVLLSKEVSFVRPCPVDTDVTVTVTMEDEERKLSACQFEVKDNENKVLVKGKARVKMQKG